jgi:hypothetical protein
MSVRTCRRYILFFLLGCSSLSLFAQEIADSSDYIRIRDINKRVFSRNDTTWVYSGICKTQKLMILTGEESGFLPKKQTEKQSGRKVFLSATGEISYQHFERESSLNDLVMLNSRSDVVALRLNLVFKNNYPFSFAARYNKSSPFQLDDQYEVSVGPDNRNYKELIRDRLTSTLKREFEKKGSRLFGMYSQLFKQLQKARQYLESPVNIQNVVQERMRQTRMGIPQQGLPSIPELNNLQFLNSIPSYLQDSLTSIVGVLKDKAEAGLINEKDSIVIKLRSLEDSLIRNKKDFDARIDSLNSEISGIDAYTDLKKYGSSISDSINVANDRFLDFMMRTNIRVGKFIVSNSELTVNNIFLHGGSIKYGDRLFVQLSAGYYDFAFRTLFNFRQEQSRRPPTSLFSVKIGKEEGRNLTAVNFYSGRKEDLGSVTNKLRTIAGISLEKKLSVSKNINLGFELAKSTTFQNTASQKRESTFKDLFTNYSFKTIGALGMVNAYLPKTKTDAAITYRYWGRQFESFNANQYFNPQNNLTVRVTQSLFKRALYLNSGIKFADFRNYSTSSNIRSKTIFGSANATLRIKKLPVISVGYYPGNQLYWLDQDKLYEYYYYILNTTVSHYFKIGQAPFQLTGTYNKFYNRYTDSLVAGSQSYYSLFATTWVDKFSFQLNYSHQELINTILKTVETGFNYSNTFFRAGGTLKWNKGDNELLIGYSGNVGVTLKKIGMLSFIYDKSYLPDRSGKFVPVHMGQIQFTKPLKFTLWQKG